MLHNGRFVMNFKEKAELFSDFFTRQCSLFNNNCKLPSVLNKNTRQSLSTVEFSAYDILKIIWNLDPNKAHGHNMISIRLLKICDESICQPLGIIFRSCLENGKFPSQWKKTNVSGSCLQKKKKHKTRSNELSPHFLTVCFKQNIWKIIIWKYI